MERERAREREKEREREREIVRQESERPRSDLGVLLPNSTAVGDSHFDLAA